MWAAECPVWPDPNPTCGLAHLHDSHLRKLCCSLAGRPVYGTCVLWVNSAWCAKLKLHKRTRYVLKAQANTPCVCTGLGVQASLC